jgi:hypothetical protein
MGRRQIEVHTDGIAADMFAGDAEGEMKNRRRNEMVGNVCGGIFGKRVLGFYIEEGEEGQWN